jgi:hypothetical protein
MPRGWKGQQQVMVAGQSQICDPRLLLHSMPRGWEGQRHDMVAGESWMCDPKLLLHSMPRGWEGQQCDMSIGQSHVCDPRLLLHSRPRGWEGQQCAMVTGQSICISDVCSSPLWTDDGDGSLGNVGFNSTLTRLMPKRILAHLFAVEASFYFSIQSQCFLQLMVRPFLCINIFFLSFVRMWSNMYVL